MANNNKVSIPISILAVWLTAIIALGVDHSRRLRTVETDIAAIKTRLDYLTPAVILPDFSGGADYQTIHDTDKNQKKPVDSGESPTYFGLEAIFEQDTRKVLNDRELDRF